MFIPFKLEMIQFDYISFFWSGVVQPPTGNVWFKLPIWSPFLMSCCAVVTSGHLSRASPQMCHGKLHVQKRMNHMNLHKPSYKWTEGIQILMTHSAKGVISSKVPWRETTSLAHLACIACITRHHRTFSHEFHNGVTTPWEWDALGIPQGGFHSTPTNDLDTFG